MSLNSINTNTGAMIALQNLNATAAQRMRCDMRNSRSALQGTD